MGCSAWFRERLRKASLKKENDVLNIRIDKDQNFNSDSDVVKIEDGSINYIMYHESKESSDSLS